MSNKTIRILTTISVVAGLVAMVFNQLILGLLLIAGGIFAGAASAKNK